MQELLMFIYHLTPEQAAARVPVFQFWLTAFGAALLIWLDSKGVFDGLGAWFGRVLRDTAASTTTRLPRRSCRLFLKCRVPALKAVS